MHIQSDFVASPVKDQKLRVRACNDKQWIYLLKTFSDIHFAMKASKAKQSRSPVQNFKKSTKLSSGRQPGNDSMENYRYTRIHRKCYPILFQEWHLKGIYNHKKNNTCKQTN